MLHVDALNFVVIEGIAANFDDGRIAFNRTSLRTFIIVECFCRNFPKTTIATNSNGYPLVGIATLESEKASLANFSDAIRNLNIEIIATVTQTNVLKCISTNFFANVHPKSE